MIGKAIRMIRKVRLWAGKASKAWADWSDYGIGRVPNVFSNQELGIDFGH